MIGRILLYLDSNESKASDSQTSTPDSSAPQCEAPLRDIFLISEVVCNWSFHVSEHRNQLKPRPRVWHREAYPRVTPHCTSLPSWWTWLICYQARMRDRNMRSRSCIESVVDHRIGCHHFSLLKMVYWQNIKCEHHCWPHF